MVKNLSKLVYLLSCCSLTITPAFAEDLSAAESESDQLPIVAEDDFEQGDSNWQFLDPASWRITEVEGDHVLSQHVKQASYTPPYRSPFHIALLKGPIVGDFVLTARVRSTHEDYAHRDACLFFGYQDAKHFYYVHLGKKTDDRANQVFIVNDSPRAKISTKTTDGTDWDDAWHTVRVVRQAQTGLIEVYWDDETEPAMIAKDTTFAWGRVGVGSFDDTADWDDLELRGEIPSPPLDHFLPETPVHEQQRRRLPLPTR